MLIAGHRIRLNTSWVNYNCAVRMVGRLRLEYHETESSHYVKEVPYSLKPAVNTELEKGAHVALIKEFITNIQDKSLVPPLMGEVGAINPVFHNDSGKYVPTLILVADNLTTTTGPCWNRWAALVRELQEHRDLYEVEVIKGPLFNNAVYGDSPHISRVWSLVLPIYKTKLLEHKFAWSREDLSRVGYSKDNLSEEDWRDIEKYLVAA